MSGNAVQVDRSPLPRRRAARGWAVLAAAGLLVSACSSADTSDSDASASASGDSAASASSDTESTVPAECTSPPPADVTTPDGWVGYLAENPDTTSFSIEAGDGSTATHDTDTDRPLASAVKVVHLGAYARAVDAGELDPNEQVPVSEWEKWYLPGTDGGAHDAALARIGTDAAGTASLNDMVSAMIINSDNAVPDYLRDRLGDQALVDAAAAGGWDDFEPPTLLGSMIEAIDTSVEGDAWDVAQQYASDPAFAASTRDAVTSAVATASPDELAEVGGDGSAADLAGMHRAIGDGSFGAGTDVARAQLEYQPGALPGVEGFGFKGGSLPGVITEAMYLRYEDGSVATAVLEAQSMTTDEWTTAASTFAWQPLLLEAISDPERRADLQCLG